DPALGKPFHWALAITRRKAIERLHALQKRYSFFAEITGEAEAVGDEIAAAPGSLFTQKQAAHARAVLAALPYEQRQAIEMAFLGGMTPKEIDESLGQPPGTVMARVRRGMFRLREGLREMV